jgi:glycogen operon protein
LTQLIDRANKSWHGVKLNQPDWGEKSHSIAFGAELRNEKILFHLILNGYSEPLEFELPPLAEDGRWKRWIDTSLASPEDITEWQSAKSLTGTTYRCGPRSVVMLFAENHEPIDASTHHSK